MKMDKNLLNLQLFAEDGEGATETTTEGATAEKATEQQSAPKAAEAKYTDKDVDEILNRKFAEWQKKQEKKTSEAERLGKMTAEEQANERMKALEDKLREYEVNAARTEMTKQARAILQSKSINVGDELLVNLIAEDADSTKAAVESFITLFDAEVEKRVKERVKGETPKAGVGSTGITKDQILAVTNRAERQRLMKEHSNLF